MESMLTSGRTASLHLVRAFDTDSLNNIISIPDPSRIACDNGHPPDVQADFEDVASCAW